MICFTMQNSINVFYTNMRKISIIVLGLLFSFQAFGQEDQSLKYASTISVEDLEDYLSILASDALEGRETGKRGQKMAAAFIRNHFENIGLDQVKVGESMDHYQPVPLNISKPGETYVIVNGVRKENFKDIVYYGQRQTNGEKELALVFGGESQEGNVPDIDYANKGLVVFAQGGFQTYSKIRKAAQDKGAKAVFIVNTDSLSQFQNLAQQFESYIGGGSMQLASAKKEEESIGVFFIPPELVYEAFKTKKDKVEKILTAQNDGKADAINKIKEQKIKMNIAIDEKIINSENVVGYIEGTDKKDELIVITAHYDHIGRNGDQINNGADDDASGVSAVMEIAQAFAQAKADGNGPKRSILFMTVTGEEKGLLGSQHYVNQPIFPLSNTVANLNIDMIGRIDEEHKDNGDYVYLVGSDKLSSDLHQLSENINTTYTKLALDYTYNDEAHPDRIYYRSDHWNFAKNDIPVIFYFNGTHPDYHRPTDTVEKIEFEILQKRTKLVFHTAWELANRDQRIKLD